MELSVGDLVVSGPHGIGRVVARTGSEGRERVTFEFADRLTVSVALERARQQFRPISTECELRAVDKILGEPADQEADWLRRRSDVMAKLKSGSVLNLAEVIRDTAPSTSAKRSRREGRSQEQGVFLRAREILAAEIAGVRHQEMHVARDWIDAQLIQG